MIVVVIIVVALVAVAVGAVVVRLVREEPADGVASFRRQIDALSSESRNRSVQHDRQPVADEVDDGEADDADDAGEDDKDDEDTADGS